MSYTVTKFVLDYPGLTIAEKAVAHSLAYHAHMDGTNAYPSMQTIAREASLKYRQGAQKIVRRLEEKGVIVADGPKSGGRYKATRYRFNLKNSIPTDALSLDAKQHPYETKTASPRMQNSIPTDARKIKKEIERSYGELDQSYDWVFQLLADEDEIINDIPSGLVEWVSKLRPLPSLIELFPKQMSNTFHAISSMFADGVFRLFGAERGPNGEVLDYERMWQLDENYGSGTAESLARLIIQFDVCSKSHPIFSVRNFVWNHLADQLIARANKSPAKQ